MKRCKLKKKVVVTLEIADTTKDGQGYFDAGVSK